MLNRLFSSLAQTSVRRYSRSNAHGLEAPRTRRSVLEPLEDRALLAVASVPVGHDVYCVAAPIQNAPIKPISLESLKAEIETTASDASNEIVFNLVDVSNAVIEEETDEDDSFIVDGKRFESYEALRVKHLAFSNGGSSDDSDDAGMNPRSGGSGGGEPETWDIEVTTSLSSIVSDLSGTYANPLVEHRCGSGGATPLANSDYVLVTLPGLPYGYISDVTISQGALARASFYIASDSYYSSLNSGFQYSGGSDCLVYVVPKNDTIVNGNAVVSLGISEPYIPGSGGFEIYDEYNFNLIATSASATILDDDRWLVTVEASDPSATERLPGVEPDYGYYTFRREHEDPDIPGDTTYPITMAFSILEMPRNRYYKAAYGSNGDYTLSTSPLDSNDQRIYLANFTSQGTNTTYFSNGEVNVVYHRFSGLIPVEKIAADLRLQAEFDWDDEGDEWYGNEEVDPGDQRGEDVELTIESVSGFGGVDWNGVASPNMAEIEIKDGAIAHIYEIEEKETILDGGRTDFGPNIDDDNENGIDDWLETGEIEDENDIKRLTTDVWLGNMQRLDGDSYQASVFLGVTGNSIRLWEDSNRTCGYYYDPSNPVPKYIISPTSPVYAEDQEVWVEALPVEYFSSIWIDVAVEIVSQVVGLPIPTDYGTIKSVIGQITDLKVDIDIDSDNSSDSNGTPERDSIEEFLEDNQYATGKILKPSWHDSDGDGFLDCWEGGNTFGIINQGDCGNFYPVILEIPDNIPLDNMHISIQYPIGLTFGGSNNPPTELSGTVRLWTKDGSSHRYIESILANPPGDLIFPDNNITFCYSPSDLGFTYKDRTVTLYVEGFTENIQNTEENAKIYGLPDTAITFAVRIDLDEDNSIILEDRVKYIVADQGSYYDCLRYPEMRAAYASDLIYSREDGFEQALRLMKRKDLEKFGFGDVLFAYLEEIKETEDGGQYEIEFKDFPMTSFLVSAQNNIGINVGLYRDYVTGKYILAFRGTEIDSPLDWATDIEQAIKDHNNQQYLVAKGIGYEIANSSLLSNDNLTITGHSLGGGLASTAALWASACGSNYTTFTFNSAGVDSKTLKGSDDYVFNELSNHYNVTELALDTAFNDADLFITAYYVKGDILTDSQRKYSLRIPTAVGNQIMLPNPHALLSWMFSEYASAILNSIFEIGVGLANHRMSSAIEALRMRIRG